MGMQWPGSFLLTALSLCALHPMTAAAAEACTSPSVRVSCHACMHMWEGGHATAPFAYKQARLDAPVGEHSWTHLQARTGQAPAAPHRTSPESGVSPCTCVQPHGTRSVNTPEGSAYGEALPEGAWRGRAGRAWQGRAGQVTAACQGVWRRARQHARRAGWLPGWGGVGCTRQGHA